MKTESNNKKILNTILRYVRILNQLHDTYLHIKWGIFEKNTNKCSKKFAVNLAIVRCGVLQ